MKIDDDLSRLIGKQDGLVTRHQLLEAGVSDTAIRHAVDTMRWQRVVRGVYATFSGPLQRRHILRAALLHAGPEAVISGGPACNAYGLHYVPERAEPIVLVPESVRRVETPLARIRRAAVPPETRIIGDIPTAGPERAVLDVCHGMTSLRQVRALLCEAVQRGLTTPDRLLAAVGDARWKGSKLVRRALVDLVAGCRSAPECELRDLIGSSRLLSGPLWNQPLPGTSLLIRPDACWPAARVVIEIDSAEWHHLGDRVEMTERRRAQYAALGWTVVPISPRRLREEPAAVLQEIEAAVAAGLARAA
jgi:hypothetical protein